MANIYLMLPILLTSILAIPGSSSPLPTILERRKGGGGGRGGGGARGKGASKGGGAGALSGGVIAGIVCGIIVGIILLLLLMWYIKKRALEKAKSGEDMSAKQALFSESMEISTPLSTAPPPYSRST